ncbi:ATPase with role in protein import into the ER, partial [Tulasnella sp. UAMH 9824]
MLPHIHHDRHPTRSPSKRTPNPSAILDTGATSRMNATTATRIRLPETPPQHPSATFGDASNRSGHERPFPFVHFQTERDPRPPPSAILKYKTTLATKDAGAIVSLTIPRIVSEPTATAIAYFLDKKNSRGPDESSTISDFDNHTVKQYKRKTDTNASKDDHALGKLNREKAKRTLFQMSTKLEVEFFESGNDFSEALTHAKLEELDLFRKTVKPVDRVLKDSCTKKEDIDGVVLVGASHSNLARTPRPPPPHWALERLPRPFVHFPDEHLHTGATFSNVLAGP